MKKMPDHLPRSLRLLSFSQARNALGLPMPDLFRIAKTTITRGRRPWMGYGELA
jgi:hypothetical protein